MRRKIEDKFSFHIVPSQLHVVTLASNDEEYTAPVLEFIGSRSCRPWKVL